MAATLIGGMIVGALGTALLVLGAGPQTPYLAIVPGLIVSGIGQGIVWTGMWIAAASGVHHDEQGVASTALSVGNAIGLALLMAVANAHVADLAETTRGEAMASGIRDAFGLAAAGILVSLLAAPTLPREATAYVTA